MTASASVPTRVVTFDGVEYRFNNEYSIEEVRDIFIGMRLPTAGTATATVESDGQYTFVSAVRGAEKG